MGTFAHAWPFFVSWFMSAFGFLFWAIFTEVGQVFRLASVKSQQPAFILVQLYGSRTGFSTYFRNPFNQSNSL